MLVLLKVDGIIVVVAVNSTMREDMLIALFLKFFWDSLVRGTCFFQRLASWYNLYVLQFGVFLLLVRVYFIPYLIYEALNFLALLIMGIFVKLWRLVRKLGHSLLELLPSKFNYISSFEILLFWLSYCSFLLLLGLPRCFLSYTKRRRGSHWELKFFIDFFSQLLQINESSAKIVVLKVAASIGVLVFAVRIVVKVYALEIIEI
jgi:hypothetical protein